MAIREQGLRKRLIFLKWGLNICFLCSITNCHKLSSLEATYTFIKSQFPQVMSWHSLVKPCSQSITRLCCHRVTHQPVFQAAFLSGAWAFLPSSRVYWKNSVPYDYRTEVPVFLLTPSQGPFSVLKPEAFLRFLSYYPLHHPSTTWPLTSSKPAGESL